jgi:hypothetical protein
MNAANQVLQSNPALERLLYVPLCRLETLRRTVYSIIVD